MNTPVRRIALAVMGMIVLLLANLTYIQVVKAGDYRDDPRNQRVLLAEYSRQRGQISAAGQVLAQASRPATGSASSACTPTARCTRPSPASTRCSTAERPRAVEDEMLNGNDDRLFARRLSDLITGRDPRGGNVDLTIDPAVQQAAYEALTSRNYAGAVVALRPQTGKILAMVSTPSYDPNLLASHDSEDQTAAWTKFNDADPPVLLNRAISETYPPGSTFKVIDTAAALQNGSTPDSQLTAASEITLPDTATQPGELRAAPRAARGRRPRCATRWPARATPPSPSWAPARRRQDPRAGRGVRRRHGSRPTIPLTVAPSTLGDIPDTASLRSPRSGSGTSRFTPLQNALIAATIANGGQVMAPYLVAAGAQARPGRARRDPAGPARPGDARARSRRR